MDIVRSTERREFLKALTLTTAALAVGGCTGSSVSYSPTSSSPTSPGTPGTPAVNLPPVWQTVPTITFTQGIRSTFSISGFVSDPNGDPLTITKNSAALPPGVTYDSANKQFVYDGVGTAASTSGHVLTASDGKP
jgi:hypothetical protein